MGWAPRVVAFARSSMHSTGHPRVTPTLDTTHRGGIGRVGATPCVARLSTPQILVAESSRSRSAVGVPTRMPARCVRRRVNTPIRAHRAMQQKKGRGACDAMRACMVCVSHRRHRV
jgi:hypothetical protein